MVVIDDYYIKLTVDENVNWTTLTHLFSKISLNSKISPFCTSTYTLDYRIAFLDVCPREKQCLSHMYTIYANA